MLRSGGHIVLTLTDGATALTSKPFSFAIAGGFLRAFTCVFWFSHKPDVSEKLFSTELNTSNKNDCKLNLQSKGVY